MTAEAHRERAAARLARMGYAPQRKHLLLLTFLILHSVCQPLIARGSHITRILSDILLVAMCLYVLYIVLDRWGHRVIGLALLLAVGSTNAAHYLLSPALKPIAAILFHVFLIAFLGFAVGVILSNLFHKTAITGDDVVGAVCGYILGAMVWANLFALTYLFIPSAFSVNSAIVVQLEDWQLRRPLYDYLSFTTLTSLGYGDITPVGQPVYSLTWLEVLFGQFYMAVVVAQMVGLKLAQAIKARGQD